MLAMAIQAGSGLENTQETPRGGGPVVVRRRLEIRGRVQGVGFRPFVARLAADSRLAGCVGNDSQGAFIEIEGPAGQVDAFLQGLCTELPPLAQITSLNAQPIAPVGERQFRIAVSIRQGSQEAEITPDAATCDECRAELLDPRNRRYRYPFINCTNCGPRYSIIQAVPYDRPNTTMSKFVMCPACQAEYDDPANRRFHAQPNACPRCGPRIWMADRQGHEIGGDAIRLCAQWIAGGAIVAVKGIGGFHLACRADDDGVMHQLRQRKSREAKPLAMMVASLEAARELADVDAASAAALSDVARPIVLMPKRDNSPISQHVAPASDCFGIMLPYAPLHHLLFAEGLGPLVMTSGNPTEEPLCHDNNEALRRLAGIADAFLLHDRDIERGVDDSVATAVGRPASGDRRVRQMVPIRRARGFVPAPIALSKPAPEPILAVGGELKSAVCVLAGTEATLSEHLGELSNPAAYRNFIQAIERFKKLLGVEPQQVAYDMHPDYAATRYARGLGLPATPVQHHHAHVVSCMADNGITGGVIGVSCDGTGYGTDGEIWGCEILACDQADFERFGHLRYFPLLGADAAARETWRPAVGLLYDAFGANWRERAPFAWERISDDAVTVAAQRLARAARILRTSSLGRLFDAVAFLLGICDRNRYEAEAAMTLEATARQYSPVEPLSYRIQTAGGGGGPILLDVRPMIGDLLDGVRAGRPLAELARAFHETAAAMLTDGANRAAQARGLNRVVLSGGCFANRLLVERITDRLRAAGREVFMHQRVPTGDGGIALGQAAAAAERARRLR